MGPNAVALLSGIAMVQFVMAAAFYLAGRRSDGDTYWRSWCVASVFIGTAVLLFSVSRHLPLLVVVLVPNLLLVAGFGFRWRAARQFGGRHVARRMVVVPAAILAIVCALPFLGRPYGDVFLAANLILAGLSAATAYEFWRDRADRLPSRYGLTFSYAIIAASFLMRASQGLFTGQRFEENLANQQELLLIHLLVGIFHAAGTGAFSLSLAYERSTARLRYAASHDSLTGLLNRGAFDQAARARLAYGNGNFAFALIDIDHFKRINDRYGHAAGDAALRACAILCRRHLRSSDLIARVGGEEFAVILDDASDEVALATIERIRSVIATSVIDLDGQHVELTISAGLCHGSEALGSFDAMMRAADLRLYQAKRDGRNRTVRWAA